MDGHFVPNLTIGPPVVAASASARRGCPLDVHLMIEKPEETLDRYLDAGADWISVHVEATRHLQRCLATDPAGRREGGRGRSIPATPVEALSESWEDLDYAVVMSVNPGWGGQPFLPARHRQGPAARGTGARSRAAPRSDRGGRGSGRRQRGRASRRAGAEILVAGTSVYGQADPRAAIEATPGGGPREE